jgi:diaminopimelate decarboxylase
MCMLCCAVLCLRLMPKADVGDFILVADTGAYTLSMYSRYGHMVCKTCCLAAL